MIMTEYKDSEVGRIPADWEVTSLADIGEVKMCKRVLKDQTTENGEIPFYKISTFGKKADAYIATSLYLNYKEKFSYPKRGDVLLSAAGTIGRTVIFDGAPSYFQDSNIVWLDNDERKVLNSFLYYVYKEIKWVTESGTIPRIYNGTVRSIKFAYPIDKNEQNAIANSLSSIDSLIYLLDELIEKKRMIKEGLMQELLTGKKRLRGFSGEWVSVKLGAISNISTGKRNGDEQVENGKFPFFVRSQIVYSIDSYSYDGEAILVPGEGSIGKIFHYINGKFDFHQRVYKISDIPDNYCTKFIYYYMTRFFGSYAMQNTVKATVDSLRLPVFLEFEMNLPPRKDEQCAIAHTFDSIVNDIATLESQRNKYLLIKHGMMQQLLTGKTRL